MAMIDEKAIRQWFSIFHDEEGETVEIRVLDGKRTWSGYYQSCEDTVNAIKSVYSGGIYSPFNAVKPSCFSRSQSGQLMVSPKATTNDNDIDGRRWILVDLDPRRSSDTNATDEEKKAARGVMVKVGTFLRDQGFEQPVVADSGNGWHLYYRVNLANTDDNTQLVKDFLQVLDMLFSDETTDIDTSVFNAARIVKVIGTKSNKGSDTAKRPQRMSSFVRVPSEIKATDVAYLQKVAAMLPKREAPSMANNFNERFDLDAFMTEHGIQVEKRSTFKGGTKLVLHECPFDSNHKAPDAAVFQMADGSFGFKCLHNSCSHRTWRDFRLFFDPHAYDQKTYREFVSRMQYERPQREMPKPETEDKGKKWLSMGDIQWVDMSKIVTMPTGFLALDKRIKGLMVGDVTVLSGLSGAGKTSWLDSVMLNVVDKGFKVAVWSGELQGFRFQSWIDQIAAGKGHVVKHDGYENMWYAPKMVSDKIHAWLGDRLRLYNNDYGAKWSQLFADIQEVAEQGVQLIVVDNLAAIDLEQNDFNKNDQQTRFITDLKELCKRKNIHAIVVCHPRKEMGFLRKESISGTADLTNLADNVFILHRVGKDFERRAAEFFGQAKASEYLNFDCVIEVAKSRSFGVVDYLVGMYYEQESRRLKNDIAENRIYGWLEQPVQSKMELKPQPLQYTPIEREETRNWWDEPIEPLSIPDSEMPF